MDQKIRGVWDDARLAGGGVDIPVDSEFGIGRSAIPELAGFAHRVDRGSVGAELVCGAGHCGTAGKIGVCVVERKTKEKARDVCAVRG